MKLVWIFIITSFKTSSIQASRLQSFLQGWSELQIKDLQNQQIGNPGVQGSPLELVMLPESDYTHQKCLDGSQFGYYIRKAPESSPNRKKWVIYLQGGGTCVIAKDCYIRRDSNLGSTKNWQKKWNPGKNGGSDITSDNPKSNPNFYDFNHVYLRYCSGDCWTGTKRQSDPLGFQFSGHNLLEATVNHLNKTAGLGQGTHVLLTGCSAGGIGTFNNADFMREKWLAPGTYFRTAPISGMFYPGPVVPYEDWIAGVNESMNSDASLYLTSWYDSALDESCVSDALASNFQPHRCVDAHHLYQYIDSRMFLIENQFDWWLMQNILGCPCNQTDIVSTRHFIEHHGQLLLDGVENTIRSTRGITKGDGGFVPSCYGHCETHCMRGGPEIDYGGKLVTLSQVLGQWFKEKKSTEASKYLVLDTCSNPDGKKMPCNLKCYC